MVEATTRMPTPLASRLLTAAVGPRHGLLGSLRDVPGTCADPAGIHHAVAPRPGTPPWSAPAGGVGWTVGAARQAAAGEAVERYAAAVCPLESEVAPPQGQTVALGELTLFNGAQRARPDFPHASLFDRAGRGSLACAAMTGPDGSTWWVPRFAVGLADQAGAGLTTSSGLATAPGLVRARLAATQELVERDALMATWLHGVGARRVALVPGLAALVEDVGGEAAAFDLTPAFSPHPVALVAGRVGRRGRPRAAVGVACRRRWDDAVDKAFLEWAQGLVFAGVLLEQDPDRRYPRPEAVTTFEDHAAYYTFEPDRWEALPLWDGPRAELPPPVPGGSADPAEELAHLESTLAAAGVRVFWRDLTTVDVAQLGLAVVRVCAPELTPIHHDEAWPFLGGTTADLAWRYPWASPAGPFPSPHPHPLG